MPQHLDCIPRRHLPQSKLRLPVAAGKEEAGVLYLPQLLLLGRPHLPRIIAHLLQQHTVLPRRLPQAGRATRMTTTIEQGHRPSD